MRCDSYTGGVTIGKQIIQPRYFNCIVNWNVKSIVLRERITPVEQYSTKGCSLHTLHSCVGTKPRHPGLYSVLTLPWTAEDIISQAYREDIVCLHSLLYISVLLVYYILVYSILDISYSLYSIGFVFVVLCVRVSILHQNLKNPCL